MAIAQPTRKWTNERWDYSISLIKQYHLIIILVVAVLIRLPLVPTPLTYSLTDTWRQADTASIAHNLNHGGRFNVFYPQVDWGGSSPGYVEAEFQLYTLIVAVLYRLFGEHIIIGRLVSLAFTIPTLAIFYGLARHLFNQRVASWALLAFAVSPLSIRYSVAFMPEATVLFFYMAALYSFHRWLDEPSSRWFWLMSITTALAVLVKPTSIHIGLIFALLLFMRYRLRFIRMWRLWVFAAIVLVPTVLYYLHAYNLYVTYGNTFGLLAGGDTKFAGISTLLSPTFYLRIVGLDVVWILAIGGIVPVLIGAVILRKQPAKWLMIIAGTTLLAYYMLVSRYAQEEWGIQYHVYTIPYLMLLVGLGMDWLWERGQAQPERSRWRIAPAHLASAVIIVFSVGIMGWIYKAALFVPDSGSTTILNCATTAIQLIPPRTTVIVSVTSPAYENTLPNNYQDPRFFFYAHLYGWALPSDVYDPAILEQDYAQGAQYLIMYDRQVYVDHPELIAYLDTHAEQIGPGIEADCAIYQLQTSSGSESEPG
ncbi:MAG: glycosyltransferase family 39 protein [Anaerolineaceae bacterium]|nr:glycosyltransferase family 39 protein [Anaerolineaceae bacterium]